MVRCQMDQTWLVAARVRAGMTLEDVARSTRVPRWVLEAIEKGEFDRLPSGIYRRSYVKAYAQAIHLAPAEVLSELGQVVEPADAPLPELPSRHEASSDITFRFRAAALTDAVVVLAIAALHLCGGAAANVDPWHIVDVAPLALPALALSTALVYVTVLGATGVGTVGARLFSVEFLPRPQAPLRGDALARRSFAYLAAQVRALFLPQATQTVESDVSNA